MKKIHAAIWMALSLGATSPIALAQTPLIPTVSVTIDNYNRAQTDVNFAGMARNGGFGKIRHGRELVPPAQQGIVRANPDTLYSFPIVAPDAGGVSLTLPDAGKPFMGLQVVNQ